MSLAEPTCAMATLQPPPGLLARLPEESSCGFWGTNRHQANACSYAMGRVHRSGIRRNRRRAPDLMGATMAPRGGLRCFNLVRGGGRADKTATGGTSAPAPARVHRENSGSQDAPLDQ